MVVRASISESCDPVWMVRFRNLLARTLSAGLKGGPCGDDSSLSGLQQDEPFTCSFPENHGSWCHEKSRYPGLFHPKLPKRRWHGCTKEYACILEAPRQAIHQGFPRALAEASICSLQTFGSAQLSSAKRPATCIQQIAHGVFFIVATIDSTGGNKQTTAADLGLMRCFPTAQLHGNIS